MVRFQQWVRKKERKTGSYENLRMTDTVEITYQAVIEEDGLEGQEVRILCTLLRQKTAMEI